MLNYFNARRVFGKGESFAELVGQRGGQKGGRKGGRKGAEWRAPKQSQSAPHDGCLALPFRRVPWHSGPGNGEPSERHQTVDAILVFHRKTQTTCPKLIVYFCKRGIEEKRPNCQLGKARSFTKTVPFHTNSNFP